MDTGERRGGKMMLQEAFRWTLQAFGVVILIVFCSSMLRTVLAFFMSGAVGSSMTVKIINVFTFPGVFVHELSHAVAGVLTGAKVTSFTIVPRGDYLGQVGFVFRGGAFRIGIQRALTGIAPAIVCPVIAFSLYKLKLEQLGWNIAKYYMILCCLLHSELSKPDIVGAACGAPFVFVLVFIGRLGFMYFRG